MGMSIALRTMRLIENQKNARKASRAKATREARTSSTTTATPLGTAAPIPLVFPQSSAGTDHGKVLI